MTMLLSPDHLRPNPYQTRTTEDPAHIAELAESIREVGLLQVPIARLRPHGEFAELAFGHTRLAAWKIAKPGEAFPVEIRDLSDRQMSDLAAEENARRKNLSAIETARAIQRRIADFGLTQLEAGRPFGYSSQGAISNLLRLLKLPEPVQASVDAGELPERLARQLVAVSAIADAEDVRRVVKHIVKAPAGEREECLREGIVDLVDRHGQDLERAAFDLAWPGKPIAVEHKGGADLDDLTELRACRGCQYLYRFENSQTCLRPACFALKQSLAIEQAITRAEKKLSVYKADPSWVVTVLDHNTLHKFGYDVAAMLRKLVHAKKNEELGLCLVAYPEGGSWLFNEITGSRYVGVATTKLPAVERFLAPKDSPTAAAPAKAAPTTPAEAREQEEAERAERREERAANLRYEHDVVWLIKSASEWIGDQLAISGGVLAYVLEHITHGYVPGGADFSGDAALKTYEAELDEAIGDDPNRKGTELDKWRRRMLALHWLRNECLAFFGRIAGAQLWDHVERNVLDLATGKDGRGASSRHIQYEAYLAVKPPPGWNKPPVHHTEYNCWDCGRFAGQRKLTKRDQAEGWVEERQGSDLVGVWCPDHASKHQGKLLATLFSAEDGHTNGNGHKAGLGVSTKKLSKRAKAKA